MANTGKGQNKGLGKGLGALLSTDGIPESTRDSVVELKINDISPNADQPRKDFEEEALKELSESIKEKGVIQPIIVQKKGSGYRIVAGERRWRASRMAGLSVIPAIVRELSDQETMEQALIENIQRADLNPLEEAFAMNNLIKSYKMTQEQLSKVLGKPRTTIANTIRLINIDESLQDYIRNGDLSAGHAKLLLSIKDSELQKNAAEAIISKDMTVRQAEKYIEKLLTSGDKDSEADNEEPVEVNEQITLSTKEVEVKLKKQLGARVKIKFLDTDTGKGKLTINYKNYDDLNRILELIES